MSNPPAVQPVQATNVPAAPRRGLTIKQRVDRKYEDGEIHCSRPAHFQWNGRDLEHKSDTRILALMEPWVPATCKCERDALASYEYWKQPIGKLASSWIQEGATQIGVGGKPEAGAPIRKVCPVPYQLTKEDRVELVSAFPGYHFLSTRTNLHDHAVAHTKTMMASAMLSDSVHVPYGTTIMDPVHVLDIYGNPAMNERSNLVDPRIKRHTTCRAVTPKDVIRSKTKWGPQVSANNTRRWHNLFDREIGAEGASFGPQDLLRVREIHGTHIAYYMSNQERYNLLSRAHPDCVMKMLIHKFGPGASGTLNSGEMKWTRKDGHITQTNTESGEFYSHGDSDEVFFNHSYWSNDTGEQGLSWTLNKVTTDTWLVTIVAFRPKSTELSPDADGSYNTAKRTTDADVREHEDPFAVDVVIRDGYVRVHGADIRIEPEHAHLFDEMRKKAYGKPRNVQHFKSHIAFVMLKTKSLMADKKVHTSAKQSCDIACASFWAGVDYEVTAARVMFDNHFPQEWKSFAVYNFGAKSEARYAKSKVINAVLRTTSSDSPVGMVKNFAAIVADIATHK